MKLLIDEMYPPVIAEQLRARSHDVEAVTERIEIRALSDTELFALAQQERRTIVTENIDDYCLIADGFDRGGEAHYGLVLVPPAKYPRGEEATIGRAVAALHALLRSRPETLATSPRHWL
ncbi:MAG: DUF5615 family PIN-like protein [Solirubrobacteraceae bacterium]